MDKLINDFTEVRDSLINSISEKVDFFLTDLWDPISSYALIKEIYKIIENDLHHTYPDFPKKYLPKVKLKIIQREFSIEANIQSFFNQDINLVFLANVDFNSENYDLYYRESYDPEVSHVFFAKFGHSPDLVIKGARTAAAEYFMGKQTPLSLAYHIAHEEGVV